MCVFVSAGSFIHKTSSSFVPSHETSPLHRDILMPKAWDLSLSGVTNQDFVTYQASKKLMS